MISIKLERLDKDFRAKHLAIVDLVEGDEALETEQDALDTHDDTVSALDCRIRKIFSNGSVSNSSNAYKVSLKRLNRLQTVLSSTHLSSIPSNPEGAVMLQQLAEQMTDLGHELSEVRGVLFSLDLDDSDDLIKLQTTIEKQLFDASLEIKKQLSARFTPVASSPSGPSSDPTGGCLE